MAKNYDDMSAQELLAEYNRAMNDGITDLSLSTLDKDNLAANPQLLVQRYKDTSKAILLNHFIDIMTAQVDKAKKGDTTAAKFVTEFCAPTDGDESLHNVESPEWEAKAIALRDKANIELSAVEVVMNLLHYASTLPTAKLVDILTPKRNP